jgi:multiple sugar transport system permease protein
MATAAAPVDQQQPAKKDIRDTTVRYFFWRVWRERSAYLFLAPGIIVFSVFTMAALIFAFWLTFHRWSIIEPDKPYVGLDNYDYMIHDERFVQSVVNTVYFTGASVPLSMIVGLGLALLLNQPLRFRGLFRTVYFLPVVTPFIVSSVLWKWLYNPDYGLFNYYLLKGHIIDSPLAWLSDQNLAMPAVILMAVWAGTGFSMVVYLAGLQAIPEEIYVMTSGGPVNKTTTMVYYMYKWAFIYFDMGYASTLAFALFLMLLVFTAFQLRLFRQADA